MRNLTVAMTFAFVLGTVSTGAYAMGCEHGSYSKKNDLEPPPPATAAAQPKKQSG
jgi:hypothetical protein